MPHANRRDAEQKLAALRARPEIRRIEQLIRPPRTSAVQFIPFQPAHLAAIVPHVTQGPVWMPPDDVLVTLAVPGIATSGVLNGRIIGSAGVLPIRPGLAQAWAVFGDIPKPCWPAVVGRIRVALERAHLAGARRIEAQVRRGFGPGVRLARLLGFEVEGILRAWGPDGVDYLMYSKIRDVAACVAIAEASPCALPDAPDCASAIEKSGSA